MMVQPCSALALASVLYSTSVAAYPFLGETFRSNPLSRSPNPRNVPAGPRPLERRGAEPYSSKYPYTGAILNGLPGKQIGGIQVPAPGDTAHQYQDPPPGAERGPCPGMNVLANYGFISRDGITTFNELVAAQQNVWNVGWDLAVVLATVGGALDGDVITTKLSIGCDRTADTSPLGLGALLGREPGLDGHNKFEQDNSLTRNDYYLANGDNYSFNTTLFKMMTDTVSGTSSAADPIYDFKGISLYRYQRYTQSRRDNPNFYFGAKSLLAYGAASFLYELYPSQANNLKPDAATLQVWFGAVPDGKGGYTATPERIPAYWTNRVIPYTLVDVVLQISLMYLAYPAEFGGNVGKGNFNGISVGYNGQTGQEGLCLLQQILFADVPGFAEPPIILPLQILQFLASNLNKAFTPYGCPAVTPGP